MTINFVNEFQIDKKTQAEITELLAICFPQSDYNNRAFFKQLPHYRLLLTDNNKVTGQLGIDYRVMNLNGELVRVFGVIDLVIHPDLQGKGWGTKLMNEFDKIANEYNYNIDFTFLVTDKPEFYSRLGYKKAMVTSTWLKIYQGVNYGIGKQIIEDSSIMYKQIGSRSWSDGALDLLGYMY